MITITEAREIGYEHGRVVPANPPSAEQAWSDWRAQFDLPRDNNEEEAAAYVAGHMAGQAAE